MHGEGVSGPTIGGDIGDNHVDIDLVLSQGLEDAGGHAGLIRDTGDCYAGLRAFDGDATDDDGFHAGVFFYHDSAGVGVERGADLEFDAKFLCEFD